MNISRVIVLSIGLLCGIVTTAISAPSARKIAPLELGYIESVITSVSGDGRYLAILSLPGEKGSECIIFDRRTHKTTMLPGSSRMEPLCFSPNGRYLWVWGLHLDEKLPGLRLKPADRPFIALYDLRRKKYVRALSGVRDDWEVPSDAVLSRDGRTLIYATTDGWVCGFDTRSGRLKWHNRAQDKGNVPVSIELNGDGSKFLRTSDDEDGNAQRAEVVSTRSGRVLSTLHLPLDASGGLISAFSGATFAPRGSQVAVFQPDTQQWVFFNTRTSKIQWKLGSSSPDSEDALKWQWSPDARLIGVSSAKGFEIRDARTGRILEVCVGLQSEAISFAPDGSSVYAFKESDTGFGAETDLWQLRLFPTNRQRRADARFMRNLRRREARFALSPLHINESLIQAARCGDPARVKLLLEHGANIETLNRSGETPLMQAVWANDVYKGPHHYYATAKLLIERGANVKKYGGALLAGAASESDLFTKLLLAHGAGVNDSARKYGTATALHAAARFVQLKNVRMLLERGANPNALDEYGMTPLMTLLDHIDPGFPIEKDVLPIIRLLIQYDADINLRDKRGRSVLETTQDKGIKAFLVKAGAKS